MQATATATANGKPDLPRHAEPSPADLVAQAQSAADHDRARHKRHRDDAVAAKHQIATILRQGAADCLAMERERVAAMEECERMLSAYAPDLAGEMARLQSPPVLHSLPPRGGVPGWPRYDEIAAARDERRRLCEPAPIYAVPTDPAVPPPPEPPSDPDPTPEPEPQGDPGPAQAPPDAENLSATVCEGPLKTRLLHCPECGTPERVPDFVLAEICGVCATAGRTVRLAEGPPPPSFQAIKRDTGTKAAPVKRPPVAKPKPGTRKPK